MLILGQDILEHNLFPILNFADILALRCVCKCLYEVIETSEGWMWDRRYYEDFPFDAKRRDGHVIARYRRRCRARIVLDPMCDWKGTGPACLETIASEPIVDIFYFEFAMGSRWVTHHGILVRRLDNCLEAYTDKGVKAILDTTDVARLHGVGFKRCDDMGTLFDFKVMGWKGDDLVERALEELDPQVSLYDRRKEEVLRKALEERKPIALEPSRRLLTGRDLDLFTEWDTWPDTGVPRRLSEPPSSLNYYYTRTCYDMAVPRGYPEEVSYADLVAHLLKEFPVRLDIVTSSPMESQWQTEGERYEPFVVAASSGCNIFVLGHGYQKYSFTLPHKIVTLIVDECLCALDEEGNVYAGSLYMQGDQLVVSEPKFVLQNAVQLNGPETEHGHVKALISDGTVKFVGEALGLEPFQVYEAGGSKRDTGVENAVLIEGVLNLVVD